jgi:hypothetical protein
MTIIFIKSSQREKSMYSGVSSEYKLGKFCGFLFSYVVFTAILFWILTLLDKLPSSWNWLHIAGITGGILLLGGMLRTWL